MAASREGRTPAGKFRLSTCRFLRRIERLHRASSGDEPPRVIAYGRSCGQERGAWCGPSLSLTRPASRGRHGAPGRRSFRDIHQSCAHTHPPCPGRDHPSRPKSSCRVHLSRPDGDALSRQRDILRVGTVHPLPWSQALRKRFGTPLAKTQIFHIDKAINGASAGSGRNGQTVP
jgi:hypothetical protein